ncbi:MAG TPA: asparagine synthase (glutamine-hydrolyzing), partial [Puia sp.]|nr:asparagine synthase (glutamine-hydrolyzing) [Puia sp.]
NSGRYVMVFNGEMYNYSEVKSKIRDYAFRTSGDSEVLLAAYLKWGADSIKHFRGMFAFAIWDKHEKELFICRDRMGVKPLYYFFDEEKILFASEVRSILASGMVKRTVDQNALIDYFSYQSISAPHSIIKGIRQLKAGVWMKIKAGKIEEKVYWDVTNTKADFDFNDTKKTQKHINELMLQSVERRLVSDVPVGAFLSGGIDSSAVVGLMAAASSARPNTFNISFHEKEFDESEYAEIVAKKFNTNHENILLKPTTFLDELHNSLNALDSPSGDGINTYVVSKAIKQKGITVALSGVGGDELFAGYPIFSQYLKLQQKKSLWSIPYAIRNAFAKIALNGAINGKKNRIKQLINLDSCSIENVYPIFRQILSPAQIKEYTRISDDATIVTAIQNELINKEEHLHAMPLLSQISAADYIGYTQQTLLKDTDQMSMAVSLEVREPFFDQDLVEFVLAVPDSLKKPAYPKSLLVESLKPLLPDEIVFRKKKGFLFPWDMWMKSELKSFCDEQIKNISSRSFIDGDRLNNYWKCFLKGDENIRWIEIWLFVVLGYWLEKNNIDSE